MVVSSIIGAAVLFRVSMYGKSSLSIILMGYIVERNCFGMTGEMVVSYNGRGCSVSC